ncbi:MAG: DUF6263 family protein [Bacteroidota bacterium]|nr:DUF6263 family protein [Bacteroidota bacterium]
MKYKLFILFFIITYLGHCQRIKLELNLTPGKSYTQSIMVYSSAKQPQTDPKNSDSTMHQYCNSYQKITYCIVNQSNSYYEMKAHYDSLSWVTSFPSGYLEITSGNKKKADPSSLTLQQKLKNTLYKKQYDDYTSILQEMLKKTFTVKMSRTGKIIEVKDIDSLITEIIDKNRNLNINSKISTKREIITDFGDSALKQRLIMCNPVFADSLVSNGEKWQGNSNFNSLSSVNVLTTYELLDISDQECLISASSKVVTPNKDLQIEFDGNKMKVDLVGNIKYFFKIDRHSGWVLRSKVEQDCRGKITPINIDKNSLEISIPVEFTNKIAITN